MAVASGEAELPRLVNVGSATPRAPQLGSLTDSGGLPP
eukprot:COSAG02_NODE_51879_length_311_cov_0.896226_2_plen_37_part_01